MKEPNRASDGAYEVHELRCLRVMTHELYASSHPLIHSLARSLTRSLAYSFTPSILPFFSLPPRPTTSRFPSIPSFINPLLTPQSMSVLITNMPLSLMLWPHVELPQPISKTSRAPPSKHSRKPACQKASKAMSYLQASERGNREGRWPGGQMDRRVGGHIARS